jgi:flagellar biogenesis protein FliO
MLRFGLISIAIGVVAFGLITVPPFGPMGPCASESQVLLLMAGLFTLPLGLVVLLAWAIRRIVHHARASKPSLSILN